MVAATSEEGRVATNGMSQYSRNERNANSGFVVAIDPERDFPGDPLAGLALQRHWEERAYVAGGSNYKAPAQRVGDFLAKRPSTSLGSVTPSYRPGVTPTDLSQCLPDFVVEAMREAIPVFGRQIAGYDHPDVVMTGVETRTSSPVRFTRGEDGHSLNTYGLYPAGEGAGYAAASCRRRSTASRRPRRSRAASAGCENLLRRRLSPRRHGICGGDRGTGSHRPRPWAWYQHDRRVAGADCGDPGGA